MTTTLWRGRTTALAEAGGTVQWVGAVDDAGTGADRTVHLDGEILPAFRDAHVHLTQTGLALTGLDLHASPSLPEALEQVARHTASGRGRPILGTGWDEGRWPERRPPSKEELDRASHGGVVYLSRVDEHSAVASSALLHVAGVESDTGLVTLDDHHLVRQAAYASLRSADVRHAQEAALGHAARLGIAQVHEMAGPQISGVGDLEQLLETATTQPVDVVAHWGELGDVTTPRRLGLVSAGGDLFCDGSFGSHTAALHEPYSDADTAGHLHHDSTAVAAHIEAAVHAGLGTGFHAIGDHAIDEVLAGYETAAGATGAAFRAVAHRLEHCEMPSPQAIATMARLGIQASVQPAFDATWGGAAGMYAERLGRDRALGLNPFAAFLAAGIPMLFGSDSPVCPLDPWAGVRAAVDHHTPTSRIEVGAAFTAHALPLLPGCPVTFAVWSHDGRADLGSAPELVSLRINGQPAWTRTVMS